MSKTVKHTPGPWSVPHFAKPDTNCECGYVLADGFMGSVATVHCSGEGDWTKTGDNPKFDAAVANAHLIASAPDLLEALKRIRNGKEIRDPNDPESTIVVDLPGDAIDMICADAIAKAEGNS